MELRGSFYGVWSGLDGVAGQLLFGWCGISMRIDFVGAVWGSYEVSGRLSGSPWMDLYGVVIGSPSALMMSV